MENTINKKIDQLKREIDLAELNLKSNLDSIEVSDIYNSLTNSNESNPINSLAITSPKTNTVLDLVLNNSDVLTKAYKVYQIFS